MKKKSMMALLALCLAAPAMGRAEGLPELFTAMGSGAQEGLAQGMEKLAASMDSELRLALDVGSARIEAGQTLEMTVTAENPRPQETAVQLTLSVPERIAVSGEAVWEAVLPAATADEAGNLVPSVTTFTRTLALAPGGKSGEATITCEMGMGTRFYRAQQTLALCVPDVSVKAAMAGGDEGRVEPGDAFTWRIEVRNAGTAAKDVPIELIVPEGISPADAWPEGFALAGRRLTGVVRAEAGDTDDAGTAASLAAVEFPMQVDADALEGDEDALRMMAGTLRADGVLVPLPRLMVCGAKIGAQLVAEEAALEAGEMTKLRVLVTNEGLAAADVTLSCVLPEGLELLDGAAMGEQTPGEAALGADDDGAGPDGVPALANSFAAQADVAREGNAVTFAWRMDGAAQTETGVAAATKLIELPVRAREAKEDVREELVGATIAYSVDGGEMQLCEPVALRLYTPGLLGLTKQDWNGVFWAAVLMLITVSCLYGAVRAGCDKEDYYCCE